MAWGCKGVGPVVQKIMKQISFIIEKKTQPEIKKRGISKEFQSEAFRIMNGLSVTNRKRFGSYFKVCRDEPRHIIEAAYSFASDHPVIKARDKMFFWKLNQLKKAGKVL
jgi:hypothetical protein